jgi:HTH-type transcriptional regulator/antitoxin HipB
MMDMLCREPVALANAFRRRRRLLKLTQRALGQQACLRQATVSDFEAGRAEMLATLFKLLFALDLEIVVRPRTKGAKTEDIM